MYKAVMYVIPVMALSIAIAHGQPVSQKEVLEAQVARANSDASRPPIPI